ncbi:MAG: hypothetical protein AB7V36_08755 [Bacteroidales bacterium]
MGLLKAYIPNKLLLVFSFGILVGCSNTINCDCNKRQTLRDHSIRALTIFNAPDSLVIWDNFDSSKKCAETCSKPLLILFTTIGCHSQTPPKEFLLLQNERVVELIKSNYLFVCLLTDDVSKVEPELNSSEKHSNAISFGKQNAALELKFTQENGPPKYVVFNNNEVCEVFSEGINNMDYELFIDFLSRNRE